MERRREMKQFFKIWLPVIIVAGVVLYIIDMVHPYHDEMKSMQAQISMIANHEHVHDHPHEHNTDHEHDLFHEHDIAHDHGTHEHSEIRAMLELMFELENKVNAE